MTTAKRTTSWLWGSAALTAAAFIALCAGVAHAQKTAAPTFAVLEPSGDGWKKHDWLGANLANQLKAAELFGSAPIDSGASAYAKVSAGGIYISWARTKKAPGGDLAATVRGALDKLRAGQKSASITPGATEELIYREQIADRVVIGEHVWKHNENSTLTMSKTLVWIETSGRISLVRGECVLQLAGEDAVESLCKKTLASLRVKGAKTSRRELPQIAAAPGIGELPGGTKDLPVDPAAAAAAAKPNTDPAGDGKAPVAAQPSMQPASGDTQPIVYEKDPEQERSLRGVFLIVGGLLIAAAFWFTSRARGKVDFDETDDGPADDDDDDDELPADLVDEPTGEDAGDGDGEQE